MEYEKSYKGLGLFFLVFFTLIIGLGVLSALFFKDFTMRVTLNVINIGMTALMYILCKNERIYWLNSVEYKDALEAGSDRRKAYAQKHFKRFFWLSVATLVLTATFSLLCLPQWIDFIIGIVALIVTAISTVMIAL